MVTTVLIAVLCLCVVTNAQLSPVVQGLVNTMMAMRDTTADPCTDFYQYACGTFIAKNPIPANVTAPYINLPAIFDIMYGNDALLARIVEDPWPIVNDLYQSCMNGDMDDMTPFYKGKVSEINAINVQNPMLFWQLVVDLISHDVDVFIRATARVDEYQRTIIELDITGSNPWDPSNPTQLIPNITSAFELFEDPTTAAQDAANVVNIMAYIYSSMSSGNSQNITIAELSQATNVNFDNFLNQLGMAVTESDYVIVQSAEYLATLQETLITKFSPTAVQRYIQWQLFVQLQSYNISECWTTPADVTLPLSCYMIMQNSPYPPPWDQASVCRNVVHDIVTDYVGLIFTYEVVSSEVVDSIRNMTVGIQTAFNKSLSALSWLDQTSLLGVQFKLDNVFQIIGHPNVMDKYANLTTDPSKFYSNVYNILEVAIKYNNNFNTLPFNRSDYQFDPMIVNAFYSPTTNTINFPAGMLESPMFSGYWPKFFQYGRMGYVVGHENTHGFDNQGSLWNAVGLPGDIFDGATRNNFQQNAQCIADFYSKYVVYGSTNISGEYTMGENIADIGGVKNSWRAYQAYVAENGNEFADFQLIPDLTTQQAYFVYLGQTWCSNENIAYLQLQVQYDVHSPSKFRVNGPLTQFDEFATAFKCPPNTPMNPPTRCNLW